MLANLVGRSESWLSEVERGVRPLDRLSVLLDLADALGVDPADLSGRPLRLAPNGDLAFPALPAIREALTSYPMLPATVSGEPVRRVDAARLREDVTLVQRLYQAARYAAAGEAVPALVGAAEHAAAESGGHDRRQVLGLVAEAYQAVAALLTKLGETELAWVAAERARLAAERAEAPLLLAASAYRLGHVLLRAGQANEVVALSEGAAGALSRRFADPSPAHVSVRGGLRLSAAIAAARTGDRKTTRRLLREAEGDADRVGADRNDLWTAFGPTNVQLHAVSAEVEAGDPVEALHLAETVSIDRLPDGLRGRRSQLLIDVARSHWLQRADASAVLALVEAERIAPEAVRFNVIVRELLRDLLRRERKTRTPGLRGLAQRAGIA